MYLNKDELKEQFVNHLVQICRCSTTQAETIADAALGSTCCCWTNEDYVGNIDIGGELYSQNAVHTTLDRLGFPGVPNFFYYVYYKISDLSDRTIASYDAAAKLYQCSELDKEDFPQLRYEKKKKLILHNFK